MKRYCIIISMALLTGLFIYLCYRSPDTVVNILLHRISNGNGARRTQWIRDHIPLPGFVIYSLPEGLWVMAATMISRRLYCKLGEIRWHLSWLPLGYAVLLEFLQLLRLMPGRFDPADIACASLLALWAIKKVHCPLPPQDFFRKINYRTLSFIYVHAIVFLSHVSR